MLNEGQIIHSSCGSTEWVQVIEVYNSDGNLYGKYNAMIIMIKMMP